MKLENLAAKVGRHARHHCISGKATTTGLADLAIFSRTECSVMEATLYKPVFCLILQGKKETIIGKQTIRYQRGDSLVVSHDLPVVSRVTEASAEHPYLALVFQLDLGILRSLDEDVQSNASPRGEAAAIALWEAEAPLVDALERYFDLLNNSVEADVLAPLIRREIHFRLLLAPHGNMLRKMLNRDSHASRIDRAIGIIRENFKTTMSVPQIAQSVGMSASSFHEHFRSVTQTTPLRYQKDLRLMEAKRLFAEGGLSVSSVAYEVGYESPNQFSREYARKFGVPPLKDARKAMQPDPERRMTRWA